jgi:hypothetical protein
MNKPISSRLSVENSTEVGANGRQLPPRFKQIEAPGNLVPSRPLRFNGSGVCTAVAGVPTGKGKAYEDSEAFAEGHESQFGFECGQLAEEDYSTHDLTGADIHVAAMLAAGDEEASSYW